MKETSLEAFATIKDERQTIQRIIIQTLKRINRPLTSEQIALHSGLTYPQVWRRMSELETDGKVECTKEKSINVSGRSAYKWRLIEQ